MQFLTNMGGQHYRQGQIGEEHSKTKYQFSIILIISSQKEFIKFEFQTFSLNFKYIAEINI